MNLKNYHMIHSTKPTYDKLEHIVASKVKFLVPAKKADTMMKVSRMYNNRKRINCLVTTFFHLYLDIIIIIRAESG